MQQKFAYSSEHLYRNFFLRRNVAEIFAVLPFKNESPVEEFPSFAGLFEVAKGSKKVDFLNAIFPGLETGIRHCIYYIDKQSHTIMIY